MGVAWLEDISTDNDQLNALMYQQALPDFANGNLIMMEQIQKAEFLMGEVSTLVALQWRAQTTDDQLPPISGQIVSNMQRLIPKTCFAHLQSDQWSNALTAAYQAASTVSAADAKKMFMNIISGWPLYGSTFFGIQQCSDPRVVGASILCVNKDGAKFLEP